MDNQILFEDEIDVFAVLHTSSDEEETVSRGGSRPGRAANIERFREDGAMQLHRDYFCEQPVYTADAFKRRFRVSRQLYTRIRTSVLEADSFFDSKKDATGKIGLSTDQKLTAALRLLAYGNSADSIDEYIRIAESTTLLCLDKFCRVVTQVFKSEYLRSPTEQDMRRILQRNEAHGCPGLLGSIDCCKWLWKNCPTAWQGQFVGKEVPMTSTSLKTPTSLTRYQKERTRHHFSIISWEYLGAYHIGLQMAYIQDTPVSSFLSPIRLPRRRPCSQRCKKVSGKMSSEHSADYRTSDTYLGVQVASGQRHRLKKVVQCCVILHNMSIDMDWEETETDSETPISLSLWELTLETTCHTCGNQQ
eukprot:IDg14761t1